MHGSKLVLFSGNGGNRVPVRNGLIAEYKFNEGSGQTLTDYSGNGNTGQLGSAAGADANDPTWTTNGLSFTTDDFVTATTTIRTYQTIMAVISPTAVAAATSYTIAQRGAAGSRREVLSVYGPNPKFGVANGDSIGVADILTGNTVLSIGSYYVVTGTFDGANLRLFVGTTEDTGSPKAKTTLPNAGQTTQYIGRITLGAEYFEGTMAYLVFYSRALSLSEVSKNYNFLKSFLKKTRGITLS